MFTLDEIRSWPTQRIIFEIKDQKQWLRATRRYRAFNCRPAEEVLTRLYRVLDERKRRR